MPLSVYEKVIHLKNENMKTIEGREVRVYNGQIGMVVSVDIENEEVTVRYPLEGYSVTYTDAHVKASLLGYAWALTIHKTQGAEFKVVAIPVTNSHWNMLNNRLLYTAITRAKDKVGLIGESKALWRAATNNESVKRLTVLAAY
jgi:exodeoxyribonuclease V alpha subunit